MLYQSEKNNLITALQTKIVEYGNIYATKLKYGVACCDQNLFLYTSLLKMVYDYNVYPHEIKDIYTFSGGTVTIDDGVNSYTYTGTDLEQIAFDIMSDFGSSRYCYIFNDTMFILDYDDPSHPLTVTGDITPDYCSTCFLDMCNCITTEEMYKIYDKYYCIPAPSITEIP